MAVVERVTAAQLQLRSPPLLATPPSNHSPTHRTLVALQSVSPKYAFVTPGHLLPVPAYPPLGHQLVFARVRGLLLAP
jgi:hypothetical protein